jgi:hypothetical protein
MKKLFVALLMAVVFISGCGGDDTVAPGEGPFIGGSEGILLSFVDAAPSLEFVAGQDVPVKLLLKNNGEHDLAEGNVEAKLYGVHMPSFSLDSDWKTVSSPLIGAKKGFLEEGPEKMVDMGVLNYVADLSNPIDKTLFGKICYPYRTRASVDICVSSKEIEDAGGEVVCSVAGEKIVSGGVSSAPVQLTSFTETFEGRDTLVFRLALQNSGIGETFDKDVACAETESLEGNLDQDKVYLTMPEDVTCYFVEGEESNEGYVKLGGTTVTCFMEVENTGSSYERSIDVLMDYKYIESTSVDLRILEA